MILEEIASVNFIEEVPEVKEDTIEIDTASGLSLTGTNVPGSLLKVVGKPYYNRIKVPNGEILSATANTDLRLIGRGITITANNQQGFDCSSSTTSGSVAYKRALGTISDPDFVDINMLVTPGIIHEYHSSVSNRAISVASERGDTFFLMDGSRWGRSVSSAVSDVASIDNNYVATYYPWVFIQNPGGGANIWVPPSVVIAGVYSNNDRIGQEWFAPAGLNRGGISALDVKKVLTHVERDELYDGRVNPIASFPAEGIVIFGQKTLQRCSILYTCQQEPYLRPRQHLFCYPPRLNLC